MIERERKLFKDDYNQILEREMILRGNTIKSVAKLARLSTEGVRTVFTGESGRDAVERVCQAMDINIKSILKDNGGE
jgi:hypothetical protein